jgi:hypothetical protein
MDAGQLEGLASAVYSLGEPEASPPARRPKGLQGQRRNRGQFRAETCGYRITDYVVT